jgi:subfamily B ATP-binding cassette protein MsbA
MRGRPANRPDAHVPTTADLSQLRRLFKYVAPYKWTFAIALLGVVAASALGLVFPRIMGSLVDDVVAGPTATSDLDQTALLLLGVFLAQAFFSGIRIYFLGVMGEGIVADLRSNTYTHLMTLPVRFFDSRKTGEITSRLTSDVSVVQATVSNSLAAALAQGITLIGGVVLLFVISVQLTVTVLAFLPLAVIAARLFGRRLRKISTEFQDRVADANAGAEESITAVRVVKWFSAEEIESQRYTDAVRASYRVAIRRARIRSVCVPLVTFVGFGTLALVLWQGGRLVVAGDMTTGDLVSFLLYTLTVAGAIGTFTGLYAELQEALGASARIFELLDAGNELVEPDEPATFDEVAGAVRFESVGFRYTDRDVDVLAGVDIDVRPGEVVAVVGPSGAGKSTLVQLIPRFYDVVGGRVLIDGVDVRDVRRRDLRAHMAAVPQETQLFSGPISENLRVGKLDATDEELVAAAVAANAHDFIAAFPDGYETIVGERGVKLSGGQRQRVAIARAILKDPRILILDEATSSLDSESEFLVQEALDTLMEGRTTFVIAHRLSTVRNADRILVLDAGRIVQEGPHDELILVGGLYADLYARQLSDGSDTPAEI